MGISNYPHGINDFILRGVPILQTHPGEVFWVSNADVLLNKNNSVAGVDQAGGGTFQRPFRTIDYAVGQCTASRGDIIMVLPGHVESVIAAGGLNLDVAGIAIVFLGSGSDKASVDFGTAVSADMDVGAANITLVNPLFTASIDALTGPIDINAADFTLVNGEYRDGTSIDTTDCIVADANADRLIIDGWRYIEGDAGGTQKQSNIQIADATAVILNNINVVGDFATGNVENGTAWIDILIECAHLNNKNSSPTVAILLQAASTGSLVDTKLRIASGTGYLTAASNMQFYNAMGVGTDEGAGALLGETENTGQNFIGVNTSNNAAGSSNVVANRDGSVLERLEDIIDIAERTAMKSAAVMVDNDDIFTVAGGPIEILALVSGCSTGNNATASTLQYEADPTNGAAVTISGASASLANAVAGATVTLQGTTLATAALLNASGSNVGQSAGIIVSPGVISLRIGVGSTTGTWTHFLRYRPLDAGVTVT